jgi:hypothetical protein
MKAAALMVFTVTHGNIRIKVRVLPTVRDVHREFVVGYARPRAGKIVHAFFAPTTHPSAKHLGTIVLPTNGRLAELIPHEVTHAVMHKLGGVHCTDDEALATAVGVLSARIARKIEQGVIYE